MRPSSAHRPAWTTWLACLAILLNLLGTTPSQVGMAAAGSGLGGFCASAGSDTAALAQLAEQFDLELDSGSATQAMDHCPSCCCSSAPLGVALAPTGGHALRPQPQAPPALPAEPLANIPLQLIGTPPRASP